MSSRKEEERNEKIIRGLMKLPPNRKCINCNNLGPQYVCTNFWTFICITCSGIHREFTHRVKSVSMAKFTSQEVDALQRGGNQRAREIFLKDWDMQRQRLPDSSNVDKIREFIKNVYVDRKYAGGKSSDKPPRDTQNHKNHEEDHRRASSYHSFSQSPPYDYQYEERLYGKQTNILSRKPGSNRGYYEGKISSFVCSPGHLRDHMYDDKFANDSSATRLSDYSVSSTGNPFNFDPQSPNFQKGSGYDRPPVSDMLGEDMRHKANAKRDVSETTHSQKTVPSGSFESLDGNSISLASANSSSLFDIVLESEKSSGTRQTGASPFPILPQSSGIANATNQDFFNPPFVQPSETSSAPTIDLFADTTHQNTTTYLEQRPSSVSFAENEGWATFDLPNQATSAPHYRKHKPLTTMPPGNGLTMGYLEMPRPVVHGSTAFGPFSLMANQQDGKTHGVNAPNRPTVSEPWNAFDDSTRKLPQTYNGNFLQNSELLVPAHKPPTSGDLHLYENTSEPWSAFDDSTGNLPQTTFQNLPQTSQSLVSAYKPPNSGAIHQYKKTEEWNAFDDSTGNLPQASFESLLQKSEQLVPPYNPTTSGDNHQCKKSTELWNASSDPTGNLHQPSFEDLLQKGEALVPTHKPPTSGDNYQYKNSAVDFSKIAFHRSTVDDACPTPTLPSDSVTGSSFSPSVGGTLSHIHDKKSTNPFDFPYDSGFEPGNVLLDMNSLQTALPNTPMPTIYFDSLNEPWFPQSSVLPYIAGQAPSSHISSLPSQGPVASIGGNPFA